MKVNNEDEIHNQVKGWLVHTQIKEKPGENLYCLTYRRAGEHHYSKFSISLGLWSFIVIVIFKKTAYIFSFFFLQKKILPLLTKTKQEKWLLTSNHRCVWNWSVFVNLFLDGSTMLSKRMSYFVGRKRSSM